VALAALETPFLLDLPLQLLLAPRIAIVPTLIALLARLANPPVGVIAPSDRHAVVDTCDVAVVARGLDTKLHVNICR
jgi:hypothetical protein